MKEEFYYRLRAFVFDSEIPDAQWYGSSSAVPMINGINNNRIPFIPICVCARRQSTKIEKCLEHTRTQRFATPQNKIKRIKCAEHRKW